MKKNAGSGREDGTGAYAKPTGGKAPHEGTVYGVAGSSGQVSGGTLNHPAMFVSMAVLGSMVLDVNNDRLDARFIDNTGATRDYFTVRKGATPVTITTTTVPGATVVCPIRTLAAVGGTTPYVEPAGRQPHDRPDALDRRRHQRHTECAGHLVVHGEGH
jgi:hypothetical protein